MTDERATETNFTVTNEHSPGPHSEPEVVELASLLKEQHSRGRKKRGRRKNSEEVQKMLKVQGRTVRLRIMLTCKQGVHNATGAASL